MPDATPAQITAFIERWQNSGAAERANYTSFLCELCSMLALPHPDPSSPDNSQNAYVFERAIPRKSLDGITTTGFIDLYRRGAFVLESKQGTNAPGESENPFATATREDLLAFVTFCYQFRNRQTLGILRFFLPDFP